MTDYQQAYKTLNSYWSVTAKNQNDQRRGDFGGSIRQRNMAVSLSIDNSNFNQHPYRRKS